MNQSIRRVFLCLFVVTFLLAPGSVEAQTFSVLADSTDLQDQGTLSSPIVINGLSQLPSGEFVFYESESQNLVTYDPTADAGSRTSIFRSDADIDADAGVDVDRIRTLTVDGDGNVYMSASDDTNTDFIYKTDGSSGTVLADADGTNGLVVSEDGSTLYLAVVAFFDDNDDTSQEDGIYTISTSGSDQSLTQVAANPDLDLGGGLAMDSEGRLYGISGSFGGGDFEEAVVRVDPNADSPSFESIINLCGDGVFTAQDGGDGDCEVIDIEIANLGGADRIYMYNNSFDGPNEEELGLYQIDGSGGQVYATENSFVSAENAPLTSTTRPLYVDASGTQYIASEASFGGTEGILQIENAPLPVELAAFDVTADGSDAMLSWRTASETNNAGFAVQHRAPGASSFAQLGFVEGAGTTNQSQSYRFRAAALSPGTHTFRLKQVDVDGSTELGAERSVTIHARQGLTIAAPNPLPAGQSAQLTLQVDAPQTVTVALYNVLGQRVRTLHTGTATPGQPVEAQLQTDGLPSGLYFVRATGSSVNVTKRLTIVK